MTTKHTKNTKERPPSLVFSVSVVRFPGFGERSVPEFTYDALAPTGQRNKGTLTAGSEREVMNMLDARGLFPITIAPVKSAAGGRRWGRHIRGRYMATFYSQLADLLRS